MDQEFVNFLKKPKEAEDGHYHFCMSVAADLRSMDQALSAYTKMQISQIVYEALYPTQQQTYIPIPN